MSLKIKSSAFDDRGGSFSPLSKELFDFSMLSESFLYKLVDEFVVARERIEPVLARFIWRLVRIVEIRTSLCKVESFYKLSMTNKHQIPPFLSNSDSSFSIT